ncbi:MAG TPA: hypothetical protein PKE69_15280 [Pyrinomonadaceae bacterium]|nr:hypothetical protein [Pyrinomonadaceae bacterium]
MENNGNPAYRLYNIAKDGNRVTDTSSMIIWAEVFGVSPKANNKFSREEELKIISHVNQSRKLVDEVEEILLTNSEIPHDIYLRPFEKLKLLFPKPSFLQRQHKHQSTLNETDFTLLELCVRAVDKVYKEKSVNEDDLKTLLSEIQSLYEQIIDLDINKNLKRILLDMLKIMENAIHEYRIRGVERLGEAVEQLVGIYIFNKETIEKSSAEEVRKVRNILNKFGSMYSFAADTVQLLGAGEVIKNTGEFITRFLGSGK